MAAALSPVLTAAELNDYIAEVYPQIVDQYPGYEVISVTPGKTVVRMETNDSHLRAGGTISGPTLFALADMGGYACVLSHVGREALAVTTNLNINFMRKALAGSLKADCSILKLGKRLMVYDCTITANDSDEIIATQPEPTRYPRDDRFCVVIYYLFSKALNLLIFFIPIRLTTLPDLSIDPGDQPV